MGAMVNLLLSSTTVDGSVIGGATESNFASQLLSVLSVIMIIADAALVVFAIYMFFMMMTASTEEKRRNVKKHFINTLSSILIILALIGTLSVIKVNISSIKKQENGGGGSASTSFADVKITEKTLNIERREQVQGSGGQAYWYKGSFTISSSSFSGTKGSVISISNFQSNTPGLSTGFTCTKEGTSEVTINFAVTAGKVAYFPVTPSSNGFFYLDYSVYITVDTASGKVSGTATGRALLEGDTYVGYDKMPAPPIEYSYQ